MDNEYKEQGLSMLNPESKPKADIPPPSEWKVGWYIDSNSILRDAFKHPIRFCKSCGEFKPVIGLGLCSKCYGKQHARPRKAAKKAVAKKEVKKTTKQRMEVEVPDTMAKPTEPKPRIALVAENYQLRGVMLAVVDFFHDRLEAEDLIALMKGIGYEV